MDVKTVSTYDDLQTLVKNNLKILLPIRHGVDN